MADKLKIYACTGLGSNDQRATFEPLAFWTDGSNTIDNTQAVNSLLVKINVCLAELQGIDTTPEQKTDLVNAINFYCVCLYFARIYANDSVQLSRAGKAIAALNDAGAFFDAAATTENSEATIDRYIAEVNNVINAAGEVKISSSDKTLSWWKKDIIGRNKIGLSAEKRSKIKKAVSGIVEQNSDKTYQDWMSDPDISRILKNASEYFLYTYFTDSEIKKMPRAFRTKKNRQLEIYDYCKDVFVGLYGTEQDMQDVIYAGIYNYFGVAPRKVCTEIISGKRNADGSVTGAKGVGLVWTVAEIIAIITAVLTFIGGIVKALCDRSAQIEVAEHRALDQEVIDGGIPEPDEIDELSAKLNKLKGSSWISFAIIGAGAWLLLRK